MSIAAKAVPHSVEIQPMVYVVDDSPDVLEAICILLNLVKLGVKTLSFWQGVRFVH